MKKTLITLALLLPSIALAAGITLPQGGLGTTTVPANWVLIGNDSLSVTAVATSSLGITSGSGVTGGTAGMLAAFTSATALTATGTPSARAFYATSTTGTATTSLVDTIIRGRTVNDKAEIYVAADQLNGGVDALYITPAVVNSRIYLGRSGKAAYSLNLSNVTNVESVPNLGLNSNYISFDSGGYQQITGASSGTGTFHFGYWGLEFRGNEQAAWTGTKTHFESASAASAMFIAGAADRVNMAIYGRSSQTADLLQFKNSSFTKLSVFNNNGWLGIASSTPWANISVTGTSGNNANPVFAVASSTQKAVFYIDGAGHQYASTTVPTLSSCGTSPSLVGNDNSGTITVGSVSATGCTVTFGVAWTSAPNCVISNQNMSVVNALTYTITNTALTISQTGLTSAKVNYQCQGNAI